jgi:hypothetical protein
VPAKLREIQKVLRKEYGIECKPGGKHFHLFRAGERDYPLPHKDELTNGYIKDLCDHFGIDREEFWKHLRGG